MANRNIRGLLGKVEMMTKQIALSPPGQFIFAWRRRRSKQLYSLCDSTIRPKSQELVPSAIVVWVLINGVCKKREGYLGNSTA